MKRDNKDMIRGMKKNGLKECRRIDRHKRVLIYMGWSEKKLFHTVTPGQKLVRVRKQAM